MRQVLNERQRPRIQAVDRSYLRNACGVRRMDGESNKNVYNRFVMSNIDERMKFGGVERQMQHPKVVWVHKNDKVRWQKDYI